MTLGEKLREIKLVTQKPYHFFTRTQDGKGVMLILEGIDGTQLSFHGINMNGAIQSAEIYIEHEKKMGKFKTEEEKKEGVEEKSKE